MYCISASARLAPRRAAALARASIRANGRMELRFNRRPIEAHRPDVKRHVRRSLLSSLRFTCSMKAALWVNERNDDEWEANSA